MKPEEFPSAAKVELMNRIEKEQLASIKNEAHGEKQPGSSIKEFKMYQMELDQFDLESDKTKIEIPKSIHRDQVPEFKEQIHITLSSRSKVLSLSFENGKSTSERSTPFDKLDHINDDDFTSDN